jgi:type III restriction enzyme
MARDGIRQDEGIAVQQHLDLEARLRLPLFQNFDEHGNPFPRPNTLRIDSEQLESGEALDDDFRAMAADEIERFRREIIERTATAGRRRA